MNVLFVYRSREFSPNMADADAAILDAVAKNVQLIGHKVTLINESDIKEPFTEFDVVFTMGRLASTLRAIREMEAGGIKVINNSVAIDNCSRDKLIRLLSDNGLPVPESVVTDTENVVSFPQLPFWMKRGDGYSRYADDVVFITNKKEAVDNAIRMGAQGYKTIVMSHHEEGDLVKFYGVRGSSFFYWYYASDGHSKFGWEKINGKKHGYKFDQALLRALCDHAADILQLSVYGGDCVISQAGEINIIDFNDWPSFSKCKEEAAKAIAGLINDL